jgi:hypothetical protein
MKTTINISDSTLTELNKLKGSVQAITGESNAQLTTDELLIRLIIHGRKTNFRGAKG